MYTHVGIVRVIDMNYFKAIEIFLTFLESKPCFQHNEVGEA
jgi:hypothetical protein